MERQMDTLLLTEYLHAKVIDSEIINLVNALLDPDQRSTHQQNEINLLRILERQSAQLRQALSSANRLELNLSSNITIHIQSFIYLLYYLNEFPKIEKFIVKLFKSFLTTEQFECFNISQIIRSIIDNDILVIYVKNLFSKKVELSVIESINRLFKFLLIIHNDLKAFYSLSLAIETLIDFSLKITSQIRDHLFDYYESSINYRLLIEFFHIQYKLATRILDRLPSSESSIQPKFDDFLQSIICDFQLFNFPVNVSIACGNVIVRLLFFNQNIDSWSKFHKLIDFLKVQNINGKFSIVLLSSYLLDHATLDLLSLKNENDKDYLLRSIIQKYIDQWPTKTDSSFVYFTALLYCNWTKYVLNNVTSISTEDVNSSIELIVFDIFTFVQQYWSFSSTVKYIYEMIANSIQLMKLIKTEEAFKDFTLTFNNNFNKSNNFNLICRMLYIFYETIGDDLFWNVMSDVLIKDFTLLQSIEQFLNQQTIPQICLDATSNDEIDHNEFNGQQHFIASFGVGHRTIDLAQLISIRFILLKKFNLFSALLEEFKQLLVNNVCGHFFFKFLLPKLEQIRMPMPIVKDLFHGSLNGIDVKPEFILFMLQCNKRHRWNILQNEQLLLNNLVTIVSNDHLNDELRLQTLAFIVEKDRQVVHLKQIMRLYLTCNAIQSAASRGRLVLIFEKLFRKFETNLSQKDSSWEHFLMELLTKCFLNLQLNRYFGTLLIHLKLVHLFVSRWTTTFASICPTFTINTQRIESLLTMFEHSFDEIRSTALEIMVECHRQKLYHFESIKKLENRFNYLLGRVQPTEVQTGISIFRLWLILSGRSIDNVIDNLLIDLEARIDSINSNLMLSVKKPCFSILSAIRSIICDTADISIIVNQHREVWKELLKKIVTVCMECTKAVAPIVCNNSPEGHLPMDSSLFLNNVDDGDDPLEMKQLYITSQMLLLNGWMTVKESVLILSHLVVTFSDHQHSSQSLLDCNDINLIIDFFYENQMNLVHRGAFEQSSNAFSQLVISLWKPDVRCSTCSNKFVMILEEITGHLLTNLLDDSKMKYKTITRRSAGLPFVVQSILAAECLSRAGSYPHSTRFVQMLIDFLTPESNVFKQPWQVVHSLNILKALVRDKRLEGFMKNWLETIFKITLFWYDKANHKQFFGKDGESSIEQVQLSYSIQNSSSMLFSVLITRVFGVKRNRNDTSRKNRMSSALFFEIYPSLYSIFIDEFRSCLKENSHRMFSLYPILILLGRLTPSISDNNVYHIDQLLPYLFDLLIVCVDNRLQHLLVNVYCQLLQKNCYNSTIIMLNDKLRMDYCGEKRLKMNVLYVHLLLLSNLVLQYSFYFEAEQIIDKQLYETLAETYQLLSMMIIKNNTEGYLIQMPLISQVSYLVHARIYHLVMICHPIKSIQLIPSPLNQSYVEQSSLLCSDEMKVNYTLNRIIHSFEHSNDRFVDSILHLLNEKQSSESRLLAWMCLNELQLLRRFKEGKDINCWLLRQNHLTYDTVYSDQSNELIFYIRRYIKSNPTKMYIDHNFPLNETCEWKHFLHLLEQPESIQDIKCHVNLENISEMIRFVWNAVEPSKLLIASIDLKQMINLINHISCYDNLHFTLHLLATIKLTEGNFNENDLKTITSQLMMNLAKNYENVVSRRVALYSLHHLIPFIKSLEWNSPLFADSFCQLYRITFHLLKDDEATIRMEAGNLIQILMDGQKFDRSQLEETRQFQDGITCTAIELLVNTLNCRCPKIVIFLLLELAIDLILEEEDDDDDDDNVDDEEHIAQEGESIKEERLFDRSKMNIYGDFYELIELLFDKVKSIIGNDQVEHLQATLDTFLQDSTLSFWHVRIKNVQQQFHSNQNISSMFTNQ